MRLYELRPGLLVSGHTMRDRNPLPDLVRAGVTQILCVVYRDDPRMRAEYGGNYFHRGISDGQKIDSVVETLALATASSVKRGERVLVHCRAGRNRSCFVAGLAMLHLGDRNVVAKIREVRPNALANPVFEEYLTKREADFGA